MCGCVVCAVCMCDVCICGMCVCVYGRKGGGEQLRHLGSTYCQPSSTPVTRNSSPRFEKATALTQPWWPMMSVVCMQSVVARPLVTYCCLCNRGCPKYV